MSAENVNAWWWMQPPSNRSLSLHLGEMQGAFRKMQGGGHRPLAKSHQISVACVSSSLLKRAGKSRETHPLLGRVAGRVKGSPDARRHWGLPGSKPPASPMSVGSLERTPLWTAT